MSAARLRNWNTEREYATRKMIKFRRYIFVLALITRLENYKVQGNYVCADKDTPFNCNIYKVSGKCYLDQYEQHMKQICAKSCGFCQIKASLTFQREPESLVVVSGKNATFECEADILYPTAVTYFWKYNGSYISDVTTGRYSQHNGSLVVHNVSKSAGSGTYQCVVFSKDFGAIISRPALLQIAYFEKESSEQTFYKVSMPFPLLVKAPRIRALPAPVLIWEYKDKDLYKPITDPLIYQTTSGDLLFSSVAGNHSSQYRLSVKRPTLNETIIAAIVTVRIQYSPQRCPRKDIQFYPSVSNVTVFERTNVTLECLVTAVKCRHKVYIVWKRKFSNTVLSESRKLFLANVTKQDEGGYSCSAYVDGGSLKTKTFSVRVIEKPKLLTIPNPKIILRDGETLDKANVSGANSFSWYTNAEEIRQPSGLFELTADNRLRVKFPSDTYSGLYQQFFSSEAGLIVVTQDVVFKTNGCGRKVNSLESLSGMLHFQGHSNKTWPSFVICTWMIQSPTLQQLQIKFNRYSFPLAQKNCKKASIDLYSGLPVRRNMFANYCVTTKQPFPISQVNGPFIAIALRIVNSFLDNGEFTLQFGVHLAGTTKQPTTRMITVKNATTVLSTKDSSAQPATSISPTKRKGKSTTGAIIGGIVAALILISVTACFLLYRKKRFGTVFKRNSAKFKPPAPQSVPRFEVREKENLSAQTHASGKGFPDVVPDVAINKNSLKFQMGYIGPSDFKNDEVNETYDSVGSVIRNSGCDHDRNDFYDVVGGIVVDTKPNDPRATKESSTLSSTNSGPLYHQLEEVNLMYQTAGAAVVRGTSGKSDAAYTPLEDDTALVTENSVYEPLTMKRPSSPQQNDTTELGEYCLPSDVNCGSNSALEDKSSKPSNGNGKRDNNPPTQPLGIYGEYCEPFEPGQPF